MKKKKMNKLLASTLTLSIVSAFSGCASDANNSDECDSVTELNAEIKSEINSTEKTDVEKYTENKENTIVGKQTDIRENMTVETETDIEEIANVETETAIEEITNVEKETSIEDTAATEGKNDIENSFVEIKADNNEIAVDKMKNVNKDIAVTKKQPSENNKIITIAENGFKAIRERNTADTLKYTNLKEMYSWANDFDWEDEELYNKIDKLKSNPNTIWEVIDKYGRMENVKFYNLQFLNEDEIQSLNKFINSDKFPGSESVINNGYRIESAYRLQVEDYKYPIMVIYAKGEWKLDIYIDIMYDMYKMFCVD